MNAFNKFLERHDWRLLPDQKEPAPDATARLANIEKRLGIVIIKEAPRDD